MANLSSYLVKMPAAAMVCAVLSIGTPATRPASAANGSVTYAYDALGRIVSASYDTGVIVIYTYDANGNRLSQTINVNTSTMVWSGTSGTAGWGQRLWGP
jgi:YD repeat-containing protein